MVQYRQPAVIDSQAVSSLVGSSLGTGAVIVWNDTADIIRGIARFSTVSGTLFRLIGLGHGQRCRFSVNCRADGMNLPPVSYSIGLTHLGPDSHHLVLRS